MRSNINKYLFRIRYNYLMTVNLLGVPAMKNLLHFLKKEDGTTMPEYALISLMIALAAIFFTIALGLKFMHLFMHG